MFENKKKRKKILPLTSCVHRHKQATMFRLLVCVFFRFFFFPFLYLISERERETQGFVVASVACVARLCSYPHATSRSTDESVLFSGQEK